MDSKARKIQHFALDSDGKTVDIRNLSNKNGLFFCPRCHDAMIPKMGKVKAWHFAHKAKTCAYDAYLHSLAEIRIAEWFNKNQSITLDMEAVKICSDYKTCPFHDSRECTNPARIQYDLKRYYSGCEIECPCGNFVADILCRHNNTPLFIEIFVTHECSDEKKTSGYRIIELVIDSEESIDKIVSSSVLVESEKVRLYGFKRKEILCGRMERSLTKFTLYQSRKSHVSEGNVNCRNYRSRRSSAIYEITTGAEPHPILMYLAGKSMAHRDGCLPKDCSICFWLGGDPGSRICKLHKRCGNPMWCDENDAGKCRMFRENRELIEECLAMCESWGSYEIWRPDRAPQLFYKEEKTEMDNRIG